MATIHELVISRNWGDASGELNYVITGTNDESVALAALSSGTGLTRLGLARNSYNVEPIGDPLETEMWNGSVTYGSASSGGSGDVTGLKTESFDTGGGTRHITVSEETTATTTDAPDFQNAIGINVSGENLTVDGVDITEPVFTFQEVWDVEDSDITLAYRGTLFALTGKVNNANFKGCNAGECLFLGASGSKTTEDMWQITYKFAASPNNNSFPACGETLVKKGWEYVWFLFKEEKDATIKRTVKVPEAAYVEKVYSLADFSAIGIGT